MQLPVRCLVVRTISPTCKRVKCAHCGKLHDMQVIPNPGGRGWRSVPGSRLCIDPKCPNSIQPVRKRTAVNRDWRNHRFECERILGLPRDEYDLAVEMSIDEL